MPLALLNGDEESAAAWTPASPTTDGEYLPVTWWDASQLVGLADNDPCGSWPDSATGGNTATAVGAARPTYKTAIQNGLPVLRFDGSDDTMSPGNPANLQINDPFTLFAAIVLRGAPTVYPSILGHGTNAWAFGLSNEAGHVAQPFLSKSGAAPFINGTTALVVGTAYLVSAQRSGTTGRIWVQGVMEAENAMAPAFSFANSVGIAYDVVGGADWLQADYGDVLIYGSALSAAAVLQIHEYLSAKWGITLL